MLWSPRHRSRRRHRPGDRPAAGRPWLRRLRSPTSTATPPSGPPRRSATRPGARGSTSPTPRPAASPRRRSVERAGSLDVWVNNAGILITGVTYEQELEAHRRMLEVNAIGTYNGTLAAIERMRETGRGHVINVVSLAGLAAAPGVASYAASKHAAIAFTLGTLADLRRSGIEGDQRLGGLPRRRLDADDHRQARRPRRRPLLLRRDADARPGRGADRGPAREAAGGGRDPRAGGALSPASSIATRISPSASPRC